MDLVICQFAPTRSVTFELLLPSKMCVGHQMRGKRAKFDRSGSTTPISPTKSKTALTSEFTLRLLKPKHWMPKLEVALRSDAHLVGLNRPARTLQPPLHGLI
eukprot:jgi/Tetstr1/454676/TSEL_041565.t1